MSANPKYDFYLACDCWKLKRQACLQRANYVCQAQMRGVTGAPCTRTATAAHHLTYERLGHELDADLLAVCDDCHSALHNLPAKRKLPRRPANDNQFELPLFANDNLEIPPFLKREKS